MRIHTSMGLLVLALSMAACDEEMGTDDTGSAGGDGGGSAEAPATGDAGSSGDEATDAGSDGAAAADAAVAVDGSSDDEDGGDEDGGDDRSLTEAAPGTIVASITTDGNSADILCDKTEGDDIFALDRVGAGYAGDQANITCPSATLPQLQNPSLLVVLKDYADLPSSFSFDESHLGSDWEIRADAGPDNGGEINELGDGTIEASLEGTWDPATRVLTGVFSITTSGNEDAMYFGDGTAEGAFHVTLPE